MPYPDEYRQLADECLKRASETTDYDVKLTLVELAQDLIRAADENEFPLRHHDGGHKWQSVFMLLPSPFGLMAINSLLPGAKSPGKLLPGALDRGGKLRRGGR